MNEALLVVHNLLRWVFLIFAVLAIAKALMGWLGNQPFSNSDNKIGTFLILSAHLQLIIGFILYFNGGWYSGMSNMSDPVVRFWAVEHMSGMLIGIILITIGRARGKRKDTDLAKHKTFAIFYIIGLIIILAMIPWPGREGIGRALLPS